MSGETAMLEAGQVDLTSKIRKTGERLATRVGYTSRQRHINILAAVALRMLSEAGWTIDFKPDGEEAKSQGLRNIWEYVAWRYPIDEDRNRIVNPTVRDRWDSVSNYADDFQKGFTDLRKHIKDDWRDITLYMVPRASTRNQIEVITIDPNYQVNEVDTAQEVLRNRLVRQGDGQIRAVYENLAIVMPDARDFLTKKLGELLAAYELPSPMLAIEE